MKNAPNLELSILARQWGATAVPFSELLPEAWLETPPVQRALSLLEHREQTLCPRIGGPHARLAKRSVAQTPRRENLAIMTKSSINVKPSRHREPATSFGFISSSAIFVPVLSFIPWNCSAALSEKLQASRD